MLGSQKIYGPITQTKALPEIPEKSPWATMTPSFCPKVPDLLGVLVATTFFSVLDLNFNYTPAGGWSLQNFLRCPFCDRSLCEKRFVAHRQSLWNCQTARLSPRYTQEVHKKSRRLRKIKLFLTPQLNLSFLSNNAG